MSQSALRQRPGSYARGEDTRRRILETALDIFAAEGFEGASTRHLAERSGVNLPAIQYYFGSKEGLYRAVIEHIVQLNEAHMAPLAAKVKAALADPKSEPELLLDLLCEIFESFVTLVSGGAQAESRRQLYARAEVDRSAGLELLHESGVKEVFQPCLKLVARLLGQPVGDPATVLRTLALFGQVTIFCNKAVRRVLRFKTFSQDGIASIQALVRAQTTAIMRDAMAAKRVRKTGGRRT
jgi:AcrR family transcriptional regulator